MPGSLQNKLQQFEVAPPPGVWHKISRRLDEEFVASDSQISETVDNISIVPPAGIWDKINSGLQSQPASELQPAKVVPLYRRIAVAAIIIGLLVLGGLLFLNSNKSENNIVKTVPEKTAPPASVPEQQQPKADTGNNTLIADNGSSVANSKRDITRPVPKPRITEDVTSISDNMPPATTDYAPNAEQAPLYDLQTVSALQPISVSAPPLRDKKGNIILDASLISNPDDEYITVTGPNGKQTKISSKFLSCLSYINASLNSNDADLRGIQCKTQFEEWRKKIIAQPAFIPTANNFFDIFELKDLLQEM
jgi:hypothetical protein